MRLEIEAKLRVDSHDAVRERLAALGAEHLGRVLETNFIFDRRDGELRARGCGLRVRGAIDDDNGAVIATMTFKGPRLPGKLKQREELETTVGDAQLAANLLQRLGFAVMLQYEKRRESWRFLDCRIELDEPPHVGLFVEIEGPSDTAIARVQKELGLQTHEHVRASYVGMLLTYCAKHGIDAPTLRMP